jgi:hypothetical protein
MRVKLVWLTTVLLIGLMGFNSSLAQDYEDILVNGGFEDGVLEPWTSSTSAAANATFEVVTDDPVEGEYCVQADLAQAGANFWDVFFKYPGLVFEQGKHYTFAAFLKCDVGDRQIMLKPELDQAPNTGYGAQTVTITTEWNEYYVTTPVISSEVNPADVVFLMAYEAGTIWIDYVRFFEGEYVEPVLVEKTSASGPVPEDGSDYVPRDITLSWKPGESADTHNIYFGTDINDVENATVTDTLSATVIEGVDVNSYDLGRMEYGVTIYWRVDEVSAPPDSVVSKGQVWQFSVESYAYKIPSENIIVTAISSSADNDPNNTINESGLDLNNMDLHSNNTLDMWLSSGTDVEPVWIRYDFDKLYKLHEMLVWNYNDGLFLWRAGFREVTVEYSEDGQNWTELTDVPEFALAPGTNRYEYNTVVEFSDIAAKSVRITAHSNWSDAITIPNYGLSEVRFTYIPVLAREPYPATGASDVSVDETLRWRPGREAEQHQVYLSTDEQTVIDGTAPMSTVNQSQYIPMLELGSTYFWRVDEVNNAESYPLWPGDTWSFSTIDYIIFEDFESYNDIPEEEEGSNLIYKTWADGYEDTTNGSTIGYLKGDSLETDIVYSHKYSAPLLYDNTGSVTKSEASLTFDSVQNWTAYDADSVRLYYHGSAVKFAETSPGTIVMSGGGADIWGTADRFRYVYKQLTGDGSIIARLDSLQERDVNTKAGIMIRQTLEANSIMAASLFHASGSTALQYRTTTSGNVAEINSGAGDYAAELPVWLKITRTGNTITSERSVDGVNWEPINGRQTASTMQVTMSNPVYIGLVVCSHQAGVLSAATFSGVETSSNVSGDWTVAAVGDQNQTEINTLDKLFFGIEDDNGHRKDVYAPLTAVGWGDWVGWTIPYSEFTSANVDMTQVKKVILGVGDPSDPMGGVGTVFFDAIGYGRSTQ